MQNIRRVYFPEDDIHVVTYLTNKGDYGAYVDGNELVRGYGCSRYSAIADLNEAIEAAEKVAEAAE